MSDYDYHLGFTCDQCGETIGGHEFGYDFYESLDLKKQEGWINRKFNGEWYNFCGEDCLNEWLSDNNKRVTPRKIHK